MSAETHASKKTVVKSYSSDRADFEKQNFTPIEVIKPEGDSSKYSKLTGTKSEVQPDTDPNLPKLTNDVICQCPEEKIEFTNVGVQCGSCVGMNKEALKDSPLSNRNTNNVKVQREGTTVDKKASIGRRLSDKNANDETVECECPKVDQEALEESPLPDKNKNDAVVQREGTTVDRKALKDSHLVNRNTNDVGVQCEGTTVDKKVLIDSPLSDKNINDETVQCECTTAVGKKVSIESPLSDKNTTVLTEKRELVEFSKGPSEVNII